MDAPYEKVLLFDGDCVLCSRSVRFVLARERRQEIRFVAAQTPAGQAMLDHFGLPRTGWESFVFVEDGRPRLKSDGFFAVIRHLRLPWRLLAGLRIAPRVLRDWVYDRIARNRYDWFGRRDACFVPSPDQAHRFLGLAAGGNG